MQVYLWEGGRLYVTYKRQLTRIHTCIAQEVVPSSFIRYRNSNDDIAVLGFIYLITPSR